MNNPFNTAPAGITVIFKISKEALDKYWIETGKSVINFRYNKVLETPADRTNYLHIKNSNLTASAIYYGSYLVHPNFIKIGSYVKAVEYENLEFVPQSPEEVADIAENFITKLANFCKRHQDVKSELDEAIGELGRAKIALWNYVEKNDESESDLIYKSLCGWVQHWEEIVEDMIPRFSTQVNNQ